MPGASTLTGSASYCHLAHLPMAAMAPMTDHPAPIHGPAPIRRHDEPAILALNNAHATELSWLKPESLASMLSQAFHARQIGPAAAFLLAFDETATYDSPNYQWFRARHPRFVYVDRIAVASAARGHGYALGLYADLVAHARTAGHDLIVCEINSRPRNAASDALHASLGFTEIGKATIHGGSKVVRYLALSLAHRE